MKKAYRAMIEVLTPVHVGVFEFELFSFFEKGGYLYLVDWNKVFKDSFLFEELKKTLDKDFEDEKHWFFHFEKDFMTRNKDIILNKDLTQLKIKINDNVNKEIYSLRRNLRFNIRYFNFEKDKYLPYIPGTSLKGALAKIFNFDQEQARKILISDFYLEDEEEEATEILFIQRYYINGLSLGKKLVSNFIEMFTPGTRLCGDIKITKDTDFFVNNLKPYDYLNSKNFNYFSLLPEEIKENLKNSFSSNSIPVLLGFGVGKDEAKTKYLAYYNNKKLPLGLVVLNLKEKSEQL